MFPCSGSEFSIIICYEKIIIIQNDNSKMVQKIKIIQKYYLEDNSGDFQPVLTFYELYES